MAEPAANPRWEDLVDDEPEVAEQFKDSDVNITVGGQTVETEDSFANLNIPEPMLKWIYDKGYSKPSKIQSVAIPLLLTSTENIVAQAPSGSGKTLVIALGLLSSIDPTKQHIQAICLCPTRELAFQTYKYCSEKLAQFLTGQDVIPQITLAVPRPEEQVTDFPMFNSKAHVAVGTPGFFLSTNVLKNLGNVRFLVVDEADEMVTGGDLLKQCIQIKKKLKKPRIVLLSATYDATLDSFINKFVGEKTYQDIRLKREEVVVKNILQLYIVCSNPNEKRDLMQHIFEHLSVKKVIVFVATIEHAKALASSMTALIQELGANPNQIVLIHGKLEKRLRDKVVEKFKSDEAKMLITTNLFARGINIPDIDLVVNYDLPSFESVGQERSSYRDKMSYAAYIHRIGRSARWERKGVAISFVSQREIEHVRAIEKYWECKIEEISRNDIESLDGKIKEWNEGQD